MKYWFFFYVFVFSFTVAAESGSSTSRPFDEDIKRFIQAELGYLKKDLCFTTHVLGDCVLEGPQLEVSVPLSWDHLFVFARYADLQSTQLDRPDGKPFYETIEAEAGLGVDYPLSQTLNAILAISYNTASDTEWWEGEGDSSVAQKNYNGGAKVQMRIKKQLTDSVAVCAGYIHDFSQNSSNSAHHGFKDKKPRMQFAQAEICGQFQLTENIHVVTSIRKMVKKPSSSRSNQNDEFNAQQLPEHPDYYLGIKYVFK